MIPKSATDIALETAFQHLLRALERKGVMSPTETTAMLDGVLDGLDKRDFADPDQKAVAHRIIGAMYLPTR